jgi:hypothetical protein
MQRKRGGKLLSDLPDDVYVRRRAQAAILSGHNRDKIIESERRNPRFGEMVVQGKSLHEIRKIMNDSKVSSEVKIRLVGTDIKALGLDPITQGRRSYSSVLFPDIVTEKWAFTKIEGNDYHCFVRPEYTASLPSGKKNPHDRGFPKPKESFEGSLQQEEEPSQFQIERIKTFDDNDKTLSHDCIIVRLNKK